MEVTGAQGVVALGGRQRRLILGVLLAARADGCSIDGLVDAMWGDDPPPAALTVLHAHISRLRRLLEPGRAARAPATVLRSTETGYVVDLRGHTLDADRLAELLAAGRSSLDDGDPALARDLLSQAAALWRGPAYGELAEHPAVLASAAELEEQRLATDESLAEARLRLGEHADLIGELESRVREHPYRERAWAHLVLALYRAGRQAEALAAYQRCRRRLIDELGIEPGPDLQELNEAVLLQSKSLEWRPTREDRPAATRRTTQPTPPPAARTSFVGRELEVAEVEDALKAHRLVTITGPAGVGKTRLAIESAAQVGDGFHHGVAFCDLVGVPGDRHVAGAISDAVGVEELVSAVDDPLVEHLASRELLLVVDNADHTIAAVAAVANRLLTTCPRLKLLVTSREALRTTGERLVTLAPLAASEADDPAVSLFRDRASLSAPRTPLDPQQALALCRRVDGLPLAIELAASRLRSIPLGHLLSGLDDHLTAIADTRPPWGSSVHGTLREVIDWSVDLLDEEQRTLLRRLTVFAGGFPATAVGRVCEVDGDLVEALAELVDRSLVELDLGTAGNRYRLLETIKADGLRRLAEQAELDRIRTSHLDWCLSLAAADPGHGEDPAEVEGLAPEIDNVIAALAAALDGLDATKGARLAVAAAPYWVHSGRLEDARAWLERAVDASPSDAPEHRLALRWLGWTLGRMGRFGDARTRLAEAVALAEEVGDDQALTDADLLLGAIEIEAGALSEGAARLEKRRVTPDDELNRQRSAHRCYALGVRALQTGQLDEAVDLLERSGREARDARMWHTLVRALTSLAQSESARRHDPRADGALDEALRVARQHRLLGLMPRILGVRAIISARRDDWVASRSLLEEALAAARLVGDDRVARLSLTNLGVLDLREDQPVAALVRLEEAVALAERAEGDRDALLIRAILAEAVVAGTHDTQRALDLLAETIARSQRAGIRIATISAVECAAFAFADRDRPGDLETAAVYLGAAAVERDALDFYEDTERNSPINGTRDLIRDRLGAEAAARADRRGREIGLDPAASRLIAHANLPWLSDDPA